MSTPNDVKKAREEMGLVSTESLDTSSQEVANTNTSVLSGIAILAVLPVALYVFCVIFSLFFGTPVQWLYDREVRRLCAIDGGVVVYEQVNIPADQFNEWGQYPVKSRQYAPSDAPYYYESAQKYLRGKPDYDSTTLIRNEYWIARSSDGKVLGRSIRYGRGGGDPSGPWHPSSYSCPEFGPNMPSLEKSIFNPWDK